MRIIIPLNILHFGTINDGLECYTDGVQDCVCIIIIKPNNDYLFGHILPKRALKYDPQILQLEDVVDRYVEGGDRVYIYGGIEDEEDFLKDHGDISRMFLKKKYNTKPQVEIFRGGFNSSLSISYSSVDGPTVTRVSISGQEEFVSSNVAFYSKAI